MKDRLSVFWDRLKTGIWFIPFLVMTGFILFSVLLSYLEPYFASIRFLNLIPIGESVSAISIFTSIAASIFTALTILLSLTMMVLSLTSTNYGSLSVREFLDDKFNQFIIGYFGGVYFFSLYSSKGAEQLSADSLSLAINISVLLMSFGIILIIIFIHRFSRSIQAPVIVRKIGASLTESLKDLKDLKDQPPNDYTAIRGKEWEKIGSEKSGYIQSINYQKLLLLADEEDLSISIEYRPGDYIVEGSSIAFIKQKEKRDGDFLEEIAKKVCETFEIGEISNPVQDVEFQVMQLVEIFLRSSSMSLKDHSCMVFCIHELIKNAVLASEKSFLTANTQDKNGRSRLAYKYFSFESFIEKPFDTVRQNCCTSIDHFPVALYFLDKIIESMPLIKNKDRRCNFYRSGVSAVEMLNSIKKGLSEKDLDDLKRREKKLRQAYEY